MQGVETFIAKLKLELTDIKDTMLVIAANAKRKLQSLHEQFQNKFFSNSTSEYLEEFGMQSIYHQNNGQEQMTFPKSISDGLNSLKIHLGNFINNCDKYNGDNSQVFFVWQDNHWLTVRVAKTPKGEFTYQVADSYEKYQPNRTSTREQRIDALLNGLEFKFTKKPFVALQQNNAIDCGIHAALNAVDMQNGYEVSTFTHKDVAMERAKIAEIHSGAISQVVPERAKNYTPAITTEQAEQSASNAAMKIALPQGVSRNYNNNQAQSEIALPKQQLEQQLQQSTLLLNKLLYEQANSLQQGGDCKRKSSIVQDNFSDSRFESKQSYSELRPESQQSYSKFDAYINDAIKKLVDENKWQSVNSSVLAKQRERPKMGEQGRTRRGVANVVANYRHNADEVISEFSLQ